MAPLHGASTRQTDGRGRRSSTARFPGPTDPDIYFQVRNQPAVLAAKLVYNTAAAIAGGWVAAWLARRAPVAHGIALAVIQTAAFGWALANPALRRSNPDWMWACLIVLTFAGTVVGSLLQSRRIALADKRRAGLQVNQASRPTD